MSINLCELWESACHMLTGQLWNRNPSHAWQSDPIQLQSLIGFRQRLQEVKIGQNFHFYDKIFLFQILSIRKSKNQLNGLLDLQSDQPDKSFQLFASMNPLHYNPFTDSQWKTKVQEFEKSVEPLILRALPKLKSEFRGDKELGGQQLLRKFAIYKELIKRPTAKKELSAEREIMLSQLIDFVKSAREDFLQRSSHNDFPRGREMSEIVSGIVWVRQLESRVSSPRFLSGFI